MSHALVRLAGPILVGMTLWGCGSGAPTTPTTPPLPVAPPVTVPKVHLQTVSISGPATIVGAGAYLMAGTTAAVGATAKFSDGTQLDVTDAAAWQSSNGSVATVSGGTLTLLTAGLADIGATYLDVTGTLHVNVTSGCSFDGPTGPQDYVWESGAGTMTVSATAGCRWTATVDASWLQFTSPVAGTGIGSVKFTLPQFTYAPASPPRLAHITEQGDMPGVSQIVTVTQWPHCAPGPMGNASRAFNADGGKGVEHELSINPFDHCDWHVVSAADWISLTYPHQVYTGDGDVYYTVTPNPDASPRVGIVYGLNFAYTVTQAGRSFHVLFGPIPPSR